MTGEGLQFEKAEFAPELASDSARCAFCQQPLRHSYWSVEGQAACFGCKRRIATQGTEGSGLGRFARATVFGVLAGAVGAGLWYAIRAATNLEIGLISILVGLAVGAAVKAGSRGRGGPLYQALAMFLTYTSICSTYVPYIIQGLREQATEPGKAESAPGSPAPAPVPADGPSVATVAEEEPVSNASEAGEEPVSAGRALLALVLVPVLIMAFAYVAPFLGGFQSLLGIAIIAFGVYEAWKINRRHAPSISGPYAVAGREAPTPAPAAPADAGSSSGG